MTGSVQGFVMGEMFTWRIDDFSLRMWKSKGLLLMKAHRMKEVVDNLGRTWKMPRCGAPVGYLSKSDEAAPPGWPQCKKCSKLPGPQIPRVFMDAVMGTDPTEEKP